MNCTWLAALGPQARLVCWLSKLEAARQLNVPASAEVRWLLASGTTHRKLSAVIIIQFTFIYTLDELTVTNPQYACMGKLRIGCVWNSR
jgi:hypothetical protein